MLNFGAVALTTSSEDHHHSVADSTCDNKEDKSTTNYLPCSGNTTKSRPHGWLRFSTPSVQFHPCSRNCTQLGPLPYYTNEKASGKKGPLRWWFRGTLVPTGEPWWLTREPQVQRPATWPGPPALWLCQKDATSLQKSTVLQRFHLAGHLEEAGGAALLFNKDTFEAPTKNENEHLAMECVVASAKFPSFAVCSAHVPLCLSLELAVSSNKRHLPKRTSQTLQSHTPDSH